MRNIIKIFIYISLFSSLLSSCDEDSFSQIVTFDVPLEAPRLVVNCNYTIGEDSIVVLLGKSRNTGDTTYNIPREMKNAKVELFKNGTKFLDIPYYEPANGFYSSTIFQLNGIASKIKEGESYLLKVSMAGYENVEAEQKAPIKPIVSSPFYKEDGFSTNVLGGGNNKSNLVQFNLADPADENFYTVALFIHFQDTISNISYTKPDYHELDQQFSSSLFDDSYGVKHTVTDGIFNGKKFNFRMGTSKFFFYWDSNTNEQIKDIKISKYQAFVYGISKEKYFYESSLDAFNNDIDILFGEPVVVNSNIKNGFGIFSIRNVSVIDIPVP
jgi:hypothetical protein